MSWTEEDLLRVLAQPAYAVVGGAVPQPHLTGETSEAALLAKIRRRATQYGWEIYHTHDSRKSEEGFPDVVLTNGVDILVYELKSASGKLTTEQARWLSLLAHTGKVEVGVWRPGDYPTIVARLTRRGR